MASIPASRFYKVISYVKQYEDSLELAKSQLRVKSESIYSIQDKEHLCSIHLHYQQLVPGELVPIVFDFAAKRQDCFAIKVSLLQCERRLDGSRVQVRRSIAPSS